MKILIVRTFPSILNFKQYNVQEIGLAKALVRKGYECGIVLYNGKNRDETEYVPVECEGETRNITVYKLHGYNILKNGFFPSLRRLTKEYDVIQVHEYDQISSWLYYAWSKKPVVIYHGPYYDEFNKGYNLKCKMFDNVFLRIKQNKDVLCMTKSELAAEFLRSKGFTNVRAVGVGLDIDNFAQADESIEKILIDTNKKNVIYVGKIEERRNPHFLLQVMDELCKRYEDVNCIIVGDGEPDYVSSFLKEADPMRQSGRLQYYKKASQQQLARLYQKADLMLFPSRYEIFGMVLLEAVYFGLPVVTTRNGGSDVIEESEARGTVLVGHDLEEWATSAEQSLKQNRNQCNFELKRNNEVSWDMMADKFVKSYELIKEKTIHEE